MVLRYPTNNFTVDFQQLVFVERGGGWCLGVLIRAMVRFERVSSVWSRRGETRSAGSGRNLEIFSRVG